MLMLILRNLYIKNYDFFGEQVSVILVNNLRNPGWRTLLWDDVIKGGKQNKFWNSLILYSKNSLKKLS